MYNIRPTTKFQKDLKRVKKRGFDISLLTDIIKKLAAGDAHERVIAEFAAAVVGRHNALALA